MTQDQDGWAIGGGGNSFPFENVGEWVQGTVYEYEPNLPQTVMRGPDKGKPRTFASGAPMLMHRVGLHVIASTNPTYPEGTDASVYLKGGLKPYDDGSYSTQGAVAAAIKAATGENRLKPGSKLTLQRCSTVKTNDGDAYGYKAWYEAPSFVVGDPTPSAPPSAPPPGAGASPATPVTPPQAVATTAPATAVPPATPVAPAPTPAASATPAGPPPVPATTAVAPEFTPEQLAAIAAAQAATQAPAWDSDPRVAALRAQGLADEMIRDILKI